MKTVVADNIGLVVEAQWRYGYRANKPTEAALVVLLLFSCQLFCDFAGYCDIARGVAYQLGFRLPENFRSPFIATSFQDFWRRWHITLSRWMRDYLYLPLGGNRKGRGRELVNLFLVFAISGAWHGASLNFVVWGAVHGLAVVVERLLRMSPSQGARPGWLRLGWALVVQLVWILSMGLFRAPDFGQGMSIMSRAASALLSPSLEGVRSELYLGLMFSLPVWLMHVRALVSERWPRARPGPWERVFVAGIMLYACLTLYATEEAFIYFQF